jgi:hypothetical protein
MNIQNDKNICASEKLLYCKIAALSRQTGYCYASNDYFQKVYQVSDRTISRWIANLIAKGYITRRTKKFGNKIISQNLIIAAAGGSYAAPTSFQTSASVPDNRTVSTPSVSGQDFGSASGASSTPSVSVQTFGNRYAGDDSSRLITPPNSAPSVSGRTAEMTKMSENLDKNVREHSLEKKYINNIINIHTNVKNYTISACVSEKNYVSKFSDFMPLLESASPSLYRRLSRGFDEKSAKTKIISNIEYILKDKCFSAIEITELFTHAESTWITNSSIQVGAGWVLSNAKRVLAISPLPSLPNGANERQSSQKPKRNFTQREYSEEYLNSLFEDLNTIDKLEL